MSRTRAWWATRLAQVCTALGLCALAGRAGGLEPATHWVDTAWLSRESASGDVVVLDVRRKTAFRDGHVPGARRLAVLPTYDRTAWRSHLERAGACAPRRVVLYADNSPAAVADLARAWLAVADAGAAEVSLLKGGLESWAAGGGALARGRGRRARPCRVASTVGGLVVDREWVQARFGERGFELLDVRDRGWEGDDYGAPATFSAGHVPHALPFDVQPLVPSGSSPPDRAAIRAAVEGLGPRPQTRVDPRATFILYGHGAADPRPALGALLLTTAGLPARVFTGGWRAWVEAPDTPVVRIVTAADVAPLVASARVDPDTAAGDAVVLDLREDWDHRAGHVPGAVALPSRLLRSDFERAVAEHWPHADRGRTPVVLYCYGRGCIRSRDAATFMARVGYRKLLWFRDGIDGWRAAGLALTPRQAAPPR